MTVKIAAAMDAEAIKESPPIRLGVYVLTPHEGMLKINKLPEAAKSLPNHYFGPIWMKLGGEV